MRPARLERCRCLGVCSSQGFYYRFKRLRLSNAKTALWPSPKGGPAAHRKLHTQATRSINCESRARHSNVCQPRSTHCSSFRRAAKMCLSLALSVLISPGTLSPASPPHACVSSITVDRADNRWIKPLLPEVSDQIASLERFVADEE